MSPPILLDTCALIWIGNGERLNPQAETLLAEMGGVAGGILASPISAWEVGMLVARGRLRLRSDPTPWFEGLIERGIALADLPPAVLVASSYLPGLHLRDPADKIIAATARAFGYRIMTRDRLLLDFASEGHAQAIAC
jgi:PIN domain nuclease of toxin-antitoxin system